jgi:hypothetical protein
MRAIELSENPVPKILESAGSRTLRLERQPNSGAVIHKVAIGLAVYAFFRILFFALAFPLFNNVDEKLHFLTIRTYAQGHLPGRDLPHIDEQFVREFLPYWSPEYMSSQDFIERQVGVPAYQLSPEARDVAFAHGYYEFKLADLPRRENFEAQAAPLYYVVAGAWYDLGALFGLRSWRLAYWLRMLNPISYGLLVWLSYKLVRRIYPDRPFLQVAVPALIAVFPQDVFFGMNRDVFPPTMWAAALLLMLDAVSSQSNRLRSLLLASFLVGATFVVEVSNCVLYIALAATLWLWLRRWSATPAGKVWVAAASAAAAFFLPFVWMLRNYLVIGDLTGTKAKMHNFGWTVKPFAEMWHHPVFTWNGLSFFLVKLTRSVWHGDYDWHGAQMQSATADWVYVISSALMILIFIIDFVRRRKALPEMQKWAALLSLSLVVGSILFLTLTSMALDYHNHGNPSRLHPFFVAGRIVSGALVPFVLIYASGLEVIGSLFRRWVPSLALLACLLLFITASEMRVRKGAVVSPYNFFALSRWQR